MTAQTKADRRSHRTRQALGEALTGLMFEKPYAKITVQDISQRADVGRSTFYAHYDGKDSLLADNFERMLDDLAATWSLEAKSAQIFPLALFLQHVRRHRRLYDALTRGRGLEFLFTQGQVTVARVIEKRLAVGRARTPQVPAAVMAQALAGSVLALVKWWIDHKQPNSPETMEAMFQALMEPGVRGLGEADET